MKNFKILNNKNKEFGGQEITIEYSPEQTPQKVNKSILIKILTGSIIGFINGFWGGGGGMVCVPLLMQVIKLPEKKAHATTLLIMLPLSIASLIVYILSGNMPWLNAIKISSGFVVGGALGAIILKHISNIWLGIVFSLIIIAGGIKLLI